MKNIFYLLSFLMLVLVSCEKEDKDPQATPATISGAYKITALKAKAGNAAQVDVFNQLNQCQQNDIWGFEEDGTFMFDNSCQNSDYMGAWSLNNKTFTIETPQATTSYQLEKFDGKSLVLSTAGTLNGNAATYFLTFTRL